MIGKYKKVVQVVESYQNYCIMSASELRQFYAKTGLPAGDGTHDIAETLKSALIWEMLPMGELSRECAALGFKTMNGGGWETEGPWKNNSILIALVFMKNEKVEKTILFLTFLNFSLCSNSARCDCTAIEFTSTVQQKHSIG